MLIGLTGLRGSGKDTVADYLVEQHGYTKCSFAQLLKESVAGLFDISLENIEQWKNDIGCKVEIRRSYYGPAPGTQVESTITFREFLQRYGTEAHREVFGENFWVDAATKKLHVDLAAVRVLDDYVFSDVRFDNEAIAILKLLGVVYEVQRPGLVPDGHASEAGINALYIDDYIRNDGTIEELHLEIESVMNL